MRRFSLFALLVVATACDDEGGKKDAGAVDMKTVDAAAATIDMAGSVDAAADAGACLLVDNLGDLGNPGGQVFLDEDMPDPTSEMFWEGAINDEEPADLVSLELYAGYGAFGETLTAGTFQLTGDETNYSTCGACVLIYADATADSVGAIYMATGGELQLTSVETRLTGTLHNVTLTHVSINDEFVSTPVGDCDTQITDLTFDQPIPAN